SSAPPCGQAFRWRPARGLVGLGFLPGTTNSVANGVNADGTVVVGVSSHPAPPPPNFAQAFRWTAASGMVRLGFLPGLPNSLANGVNADGTAVVGVSSVLQVAPGKPSAGSTAPRPASAFCREGTKALPTA